jgi:hypothetical protein
VYAGIQEGSMTSTGWKATKMPRVTFDAKVADIPNPQTFTALDAEVELPDGSIALVGSVRYHGVNDGWHRWSGEVKQIKTAGEKLRL